MSHVLSVGATNEVSKAIVGACVSAMSSAAAGYLLNPSLQPWVGAVFGAVRYVSEIPLSMLCEKLLNTDSPLAVTAAKTLAKGLSFLGGVIAAWAALSVIGIPMAGPYGIVLAGASSLVSAVADRVMATAVFRTVRGYVWAEPSQSRRL